MTSIQPYAIDISTWRADENFGLAYPEGARPKRAVYSPDWPIPGIKPNWRYLFKLSARPYPEQYWAEVIAYHVGLDLGVQVPPAFAAYDSCQGQCGALIEWFYEDRKEMFYAAGDAFQRIIPDFDRDLGTQHNFVDAVKISETLLGVEPLAEFARMLIFDALIGNSDRHQDNWGFIIRTDADAKDGFTLSFSPWFDNGTSMGHERFARKFNAWGEREYINYISKGRHHLRASRNSETRLTHLDSIRMMTENAPSVAESVQTTLQKLDLKRLQAYLEQLAALETLEGGRLSRDRVRFIYRLFEYRVALVGDILK